MIEFIVGSLLVNLMYLFCGDVLVKEFVVVFKLLLCWGIWMIGYRFFCEYFYCDVYLLCEVWLFCVELIILLILLGGIIN